MKKIIIIIIHLFAFYNLYAQPNIDKKRDFNYFTGYGTRAHNDYERFGTTLSDFNYCNVQQNFKYNPLDFNGTVAVMSDTAGKVLFTFNGYTITDSSYQIMQNGDSLCLPDYTYPDGSYVVQGTIALPKPNFPNIYYLFHHPPSYNNTPFRANRYLNLTTIDMSLNNGKGRVISREQRLLQDTAAGMFMKVCRHANGRDWWLLRGSTRFDEFYRLLISPNGVDSLPPQYLPALPTQSLGTNSVEYSPDGSLLAFKVPYHGIYIYDFDRCTGLLSNNRYIPRVSNYVGESFAGICFSPNARYLYCTNDTSVVQYDLQANDIAASKVQVGAWDRTIIYPPYNYNTKFFQPFLAPNGKIYINGIATTKMWHTIHNPNGAGTTCDLRLHDVLLPTIYYGTTPNFPNYRLGALRGSICDTLGIEEGAEYICEPNTTASISPSQKDEHIRIFPNPVSNDFTLQYADYQNKQVIITNALGIIQEKVSLQSENTTITAQNLPNGIYYISIYENNTLLGSTKFVVLHK